jgi:hypothetical protein
MTPAADGHGADALRGKALADRAPIGMVHGQRMDHENTLGRGRIAMHFIDNLLAIAGFE